MDGRGFGGEEGLSVPYVCRYVNESVCSRSPVLVAPPGLDAATAICEYASYQLPVYVVAA